MTLELNLTAEDRADTRKVEIPVEVKSESGFQPRREYDIEIGDVRVAMPTEAEQYREELRQIIENSSMDSEKFQKVRATLEALREEGK